jgi:hypothetical protein
MTSRQRLPHLEVTGLRFAIDATGKIVGTFPTIKAALASFGRPR